MARENPGNIVPSQNTILTITDMHGQIVMEITDEETLVVDSHNSITNYNRTSGIQLVCGTVWTRQMLFAKPPVYVSVCEDCRHPRFSFWRRPRASHGLVAMHRAKFCVACGRNCCPSHRKLGKDNKWRCLACHQRHTLGHLLRPVFFEKKGHQS